MAKLEATSVPFPEPDYKSSVPFDQQPDALQFKAMQEVSNNLDLDAGEIVGGILRWQRGDGYAFYVVTKDRPLTVRHLGYMDAWQVEDALIRGLNKQDVLVMLLRTRAMHELFSKKQP